MPATATAEPELDPPEIRGRGGRRLRGVSVRRAHPTRPVANWSRLVLPSQIAPASMRRWTTGADSSWGVGKCRAPRSGRVSGAIDVVLDDERNAVKRLLVERLHGDLAGPGEDGLAVGWVDEDVLVPAGRDAIEEGRDGAFDGEGARIIRGAQGSDGEVFGHESSSMMRSGCPAFTVSPDFTRISRTVPAAEASTLIRFSSLRG